MPCTSTSTCQDACPLYPAVISSWSPSFFVASSSSAARGARLSLAWLSLLLLRHPWAVPNPPFHRAVPRAPQTNAPRIPTFSANIGDPGCLRPGDDVDYQTNLRRAATTAWPATPGQRHPDPPDGCACSTPASGHEAVQQPSNPPVLRLQLRHEGRPLQRGRRAATPSSRCANLNSEGLAAEQQTAQLQHTSTRTASARSPPTVPALTLRRRWDNTSARLSARSPNYWTAGAPEGAAPRNPRLPG